MSARTTPYKTVFSGTLVQRTAFSIGGNEPTPIVDSPLARDGLGRPTMRGTGLAGALLATARTLYPELPPCVSEGLAGEATGSDDSPRMRESVWRLFTSHPVATGTDTDPEHFFTDPEPDYRAGVAILHATGAAAERLHFETEVLPAGTRWWFCLEVDDYRDEDTHAAALAACALAEWEDGFCWLGRDVARGLGWMRMEDLQVHRLDTRHVTQWPRASMPPWQTVTALPAETRLDSDGLAALRAETEPHQKPRRLVGRGEILVGLSADHDWGLDSLSVGGSNLGVNTPPPQDFVRPRDEDEQAWVKNAAPDQVIAWAAHIDANGDVTYAPLIPGSGIRGSLRHTLSWWLRSRTQALVHDPSLPAPPDDDSADKTPDEVARMFGTVEESAPLLLSDARLMTEPGDTGFELLLLEQHAEDEFTGAAFESAKFNRMCLVRGRFSFEFVLQVNDRGARKEFDLFGNHLELLDGLGKANFVPLGGANWRGHGWVTLQLAEATATEHAS